MIGLGFYNVTQTTTDLNGPFLRFTSEPESSTVNDGGSVTFTGIATAEFKHNPTIPGERVTNTGTIGYQWYIDGVAAEDIAGKISGAETNELTLSNLVSPTDNAKSVFLRAIYNGSAYQSVGGDVTAGIAASTGNGVNQPVDTSTITVSVNPTITISSQPSDATAGQGIDATFTVSVSTSDSSSVTYQWNQDGSPLSDSDTVSGANTPSLTISSETVGTSSITVTVSHPTAGNSPITSNAATFTVVALRALVSWEKVNGSGTFFGSGSQDLGGGDLRFEGDPSNATILFSFFAPEKDTKIRMTLAGAKGEDRGQHSGGEGGLTVFNITLEKNTEYILKLGSQSQPSGGVNGGGGGAFLYKKGRIIVVSGGGGGAGTGGGGGIGGGAGVRGTDGNGRNAGRGGIVAGTGSLPTVGYSPGGEIYDVNWTSPDGGRVSACAPGSAWFRNRYSPCEDLGVSKLRTFRGYEFIGQTAEIDRGWKAGIGNRNNGGNGSGNEGGGGAGAYGGDAATGNGSGGGGASGYTSGDVEIVSSRNGGNTVNVAYALLELFTG